MYLVYLKLGSIIVVFIATISTKFTDDSHQDARADFVASETLEVAQKLFAAELNCAASA